MDKAVKTWIDKATYAELLETWRFGEHGDPRFRGETGEYYFRSMFTKQGKLADRGEAVSAKIGFVNPKFKEEPTPKTKRRAKE